MAVSAQYFVFVLFSLAYDSFVLGSFSFVCVDSRLPFILLHFLSHDTSTVPPFAFAAGARVLLRSTFSTTIVSTLPPYLYCAY
ncbi:hypothetical protein BJY52DRAFT_1291290 [Lactarius psammicola]|nr:hypothetical protein BJY52DRAFT_1291290 [Lactarius psammicola]